MNIYRKILLLFFFLISFNIVNASPQLPDYIIYKNDTIPIYNLLGETFLQKQNPNEEKLFGLSFRPSLEGTSFNCWRGYQAIYKIENDSLFVIDIIDCFTIKSINQQKSKEKIKSIFANKVKNDKVFIDWFDGEISFPLNTIQNEIVRWDGIFENIYCFETLMSIKNGKVTRYKQIENYIDDKDRINRKKDDSVASILFEYIKNFKWTKLEKFDCSEKYRIVINKDGEIDSVEMNLTKQEIKDFYKRNEYNYCVNTLKKALINLKFDLIKRKGIPIEETVNLEIFFDQNGTIENWNW